MTSSRFTPEAARPRRCSTPPKVKRHGSQLSPGRRPQGVISCTDLLTHAVSPRLQGTIRGCTLRSSLSSWASGAAAPAAVAERSAWHRRVWRRTRRSISCRAASGRSASGRRRRLPSRGGNPLATAASPRARSRPCSMAPGRRPRTERNLEPGLTVGLPQCGKIRAPIKDPEVKVFSSSWSVKKKLQLHCSLACSVQTLNVALHVQRREGRGEAAAAAVIRGPARRDRSILPPSSGGGPR